MNSNNHNSQMRRLEDTSASSYFLEEISASSYFLEAISASSYFSATRNSEATEGLEHSIQDSRTLSVIWKAMSR
jgi:hypothetical protein